MKDERKVAYEWVIVMSKGEDIVLTENQYAYFDENRKENYIIFDNFEFNPAFIVQAYKRPAEIIKDYYPCETCHTSGWEITKEGKRIVCSKCGGTGVDLK